MISSIRTVAAFTGENKEIQRYEEKQDEALLTAIKAGVGYVVDNDQSVFDKNARNHSHRATRPSTVPVRCTTLSVYPRLSISRMNPK